MGLFSVLWRLIRPKRPMHRPAASVPLSVQELEPRDVPNGTTLTALEVHRLLRRAVAASASRDAIIAIVDRGGNLLGVRVEPGVSPGVLGSNFNLVFAIDGALSKARTAAFFANDQAPLTTRTVQFISQSTIRRREVNSNPNIPDLFSPLRGPGFVAPVGLGGHFPPRVRNTPPVDLFGIEHTNRDSLINPGPDRVKGTADDLLLPSRFNVNPAFVPAGKQLSAPESYGLISGLLPSAQSRGIATLPGGIPLYKNGSLVGGIGVFFPGATGFASEENSALSDVRRRGRPDRSLEAEYIAFAAAGGSSAAGAPIGALGGEAPLAGFDLPFGRIDLAGITLDIYGPRGGQGVFRLVQFGQSLGTGNPDDAVRQPIGAGADPQFLTRSGVAVPEGWLVQPHDGVGVSADEVRRIIEQGIAEAALTRAQIRLPLGSRTNMVFAVSDLRGEVVGLFRMPDATVFSIDVAVAKSRNASYYADPGALQGIDRTPGVPRGVAFTARTFRFVAQPRFPEGIDSAPPGPFSSLNDRNRVAARVRSVYGFDAFFPMTNFRNMRDDLRNQNGVVFFPGSSAVFHGGSLSGGLGVSGDGVDQDDVVTFGAVRGFDPPGGRRADRFFVRGVRLPHFKFPRNPRA